MNAKLYNSMMKQYAKIRKEVYGVCFRNSEDVVNSLRPCIENEKERSIYDAIIWLIETDRLPTAKQAWLEDATGGQVKKMFAKACKIIGEDLSMYAARAAIYKAID